MLGNMPSLSRGHSEWSEGMSCKNYNFDETVPRRNTGCYKWDKLQDFYGSSDLIPLWVADMDFRTPDFVVQAIRDRAAHEIYGYTFRTPQFNEAICNWFRRRHHWDIDPGWISFSPGVVPAINLLVLALTNPGDEIIIQPPVYFPFYGAVENHGRKLVLNPLNFDGNTYTFDLEDLRGKMSASTRMLILSNPHNPVGRAWTKEELADLATLCVRNNVLIVSDEIHCDLTLPGFTHIPLASVSEEIAGHTITTIAPSKTFNLAGLSTSAVICSDSGIKVAYDRMLDNIHVGMGNLFGLEALQAAYNRGDEWLDQLRQYINGNYRFVAGFLKEHISEIAPIPLEATYLLWLDCRRLGFETSEALKQFMIDQAGLAMSEGASFGPGGEGFMRMNLACPRSLLTQALHRLRQAITKRNH